MKTLTDSQGFQFVRNERCKTCKIIERCSKDFAFSYNEILVQYDSGGSVYVNTLIKNRFSEDYKRVLTAAESFAKTGKNVEITPKFDSPRECPAYDSIYGSLKGTEFYGKCPDLKIDNNWFEHEGFITENSKNAFRNMLKHGLKQSDRIIIENCNLTDAFMKRVIYQHVENGMNISEVWVIKKGILSLLYKKLKE